MKLIFKKLLKRIESQFDRVGQKKRMLNFYKNFVGEGSLCFDVGANVGNRTEIFLSLRSKVIAVEPQEKCMGILKEKYGNNKSVVLVNSALGRQVGEAEMMISEASTVSSMSKDWIDSVKTSGRFGSISWDKKSVVPVTTMDYLIEKYGTPDFCKIDVEGFESEVVSGLNKPISVISFEFTPEFIEKTLECIDHLSRVGNYEYNYSIGESMKMDFNSWISSSDIKKNLVSLRDQTVFGDVYARLVK